MHYALIRHSGLESLIYRRTCGKCVADSVLPFDLLFTVTNRVSCLYLIGIAGLNEIPIEGFGAGEGI